MSNHVFGEAKNVDPDLPMSPDGTTYHLSCRGGDLADCIILVGDPGRVKTVAEYFDKDSLTFEASHREINIATGKYKGVPVSVISTGMGTDNVEIVVNEIHVLKEYDVQNAMWRVRPGDADAAKAKEVFEPSRVKLIRVGTCGSPNPDVTLGSLAVTRYAVGLDNTCQYYEAPAVNDSADVKEVLAQVKKTTLGKIQIYATRAAPAITNSLVRACEGFNKDKSGEAKQDYYVGTTCSCSGFYACQGRSVGRFRGHIVAPNLMEELGKVSFKVSEGVEKVANLEMENSSLCFLSNCLGYQAGTVCVVIAKRSEEGRAFATPDQAAAGLANAIQIALDAVTTC